MNGRSKKQNRGTTLVELIVTIVFLSVCVAPMLSMVNSTQVRANDTRARMVAIAVAQDELEKERTKAKKTAPTLGLLTSIVNSVTGLLGSAKVTTSITSAGVPKLYNISVEVEYDDKGSKVSLSTKVRGA